MISEGVIDSGVWAEVERIVGSAAILSASSPALTAGGGIWYSTVRSWKFDGAENSAGLCDAPNPQA